MIGKLLEALGNVPLGQNELEREAQQLMKPFLNESEDLATHVDACTRRYTSLWVALRASLSQQARIEGVQKLLTFFVLALLFVNIFDINIPVSFVGFLQ